METYRSNISGNDELCPGCSQFSNKISLLPCKHVVCERCVPVSRLGCPTCKEADYPMATPQSSLSTLCNVTKSPNEFHASTQYKDFKQYPAESPNTFPSMSYIPTESHNRVPLHYSSSSLAPSRSSNFGAIGSERKNPPQSSSNINLSSQISSLNISTSHNPIRTRNFSISSEASSGASSNYPSLTPPKTPDLESRTYSLSPNVFTNLPTVSPNIYSDPINHTQIPSCTLHHATKYYCWNCLQFICRACHQNHECHRYNHFRESEDKLSTDLLETLKQTSEIERKMYRDMKEFNEMTYAMEINEIREEICSWFHNVKKDISLREKTLIEEGENVFKYTMEQPRTYQKMLNNARDTIINLEQSTKTSLERGNFNELRRCQIYLKDQFNKLKLPNFDALDKEKYNEICKIRTFESLPCSSKASASYAVVSGIATKTLVLNQKTYFTITCFDHSGRREKSVIEEITASITFPNGNTVSVSIKDLNNGIYQGKILTSQPGEHYLKINLRGLDIANLIYKPFAIKKRGINDIITTGSTIFGKDGNAELSLIRGWGIHCDKDGTIYVTDKERHCVFVFNHELKFVKRFGKYGYEDGELFRPNGITMDRDDRIIVADKDNHRIQLFSTDGEFLMKIGVRGEAAGQFHYPWDVATNSKGDIAVSDSEHNRIQLFDKSGNIIVVHNLRHMSTGLGKSGPRGICFDGDDAIFVTEFQKNFLTRFEIKWELKKMIHDWNVGICSKFTRDFDHLRRRFHGKVEKSKGEFDKPQGIIISEGYILIAEANNKRIVVLSVKDLYKNRQNRNNYRTYMYTGKYIILEIAGYSDFEPCDVAFTPDGYLLAVDKNDKIYKFAASSSSVQQYSL